MLAQTLTLHSHTPTLNVIDPRGLAIRSVAYCRSAEGGPAEARINGTAHDPAGRAIAQWDPRLFSDASAPANLISVYSLSGKVLSSASVDAGLRVSLFGEADQLVHGWDGRGSQRWTEYDQLMRPQAVFEQAVDYDPFCTERYGYGGADPVFVDHNQCGQLIRHDDPAGTQLFGEFGLTGALLEQIQHFLRELDSPDWPVSLDDRDQLLEPGAGATTQSRFNPLGEVIEQIDAKGNRQFFSQTVGGQLRKSRLQLKGKSNSQLLVSAIQYNAHGQTERETAGNGVITTLEYRPEDGRLTRLQARCSGGDALQDLNYCYDPVGNVLSIEDAALPIRYFANQRIDPISCYFYDSLYQLIEATGWEAGGANKGPQSSCFDDPAPRGNYRQTYGYDRVGNLLKLTHEGPQNHGRSLTAARYSNRCLPEQNGQPPSEAEIAAAFDANGNLLNLQPGQALSWDLRNQLKEVRPIARDSGLNDIERYIYGADGMRRRKVRSTQTHARTLNSEVRYLPGLEIRTHSSTGEELHVIVAQAGRSSVRVLHWETEPPKDLANNQYRYSVADHLGSCTLELDSTSEVISQERYHPFGSTAWFAGKGEVEASCKTVRYSGKERDATGLYYYGFRYYVPWLQRWINPDPAEGIDGPNRYRAMRNNPLFYLDDDGLIPTPPSPHFILVGTNANTVGSETASSASVSARLSALNPWRRNRPNNGISTSQRQLDASYLQVSSVLKLSVKGVSVEAQKNLSVMEDSRQFVGVMSVRDQRIDIAISSQLGFPGSERDTKLPDRVSYKVGPKSPSFRIPLEALHTVGRRADGAELDFTGHSMMVKILSGKEKDFIGFSGYKKPDGVIRLKWSSRTLNPEHASFMSKYHLGNPGFEQRDYVLSRKYQDIVVKHFKRSDYTVNRD